MFRGERSRGLRRSKKQVFEDKDVVGESCTKSKVLRNGIYSV